MNKNLLMLAIVGIITIIIAMLFVIFDVPDNAVDLNIDLLLEDECIFHEQFWNNTSQTCHAFPP